MLVASGWLPDKRAYVVDNNNGTLVVSIQSDGPKVFYLTELEINLLYADLRLIAGKQFKFPK